MIPHTCAPFPPSTWVLGAVVLVLLGPSGCGPRVQPSGEVWVNPQALPVDYVLTGANPVIVVRNNFGQPIVEVEVQHPGGSLMGGSIDGTPLAPGGVIDGTRDSIRGTWESMTSLFVETEYEQFPPETLGIFPVWFSYPVAKVGDTLVFPVELVLEDGSVLNWDGPPGSERPAPRLVVRRARRVGGKTGRVIVAIALIPLLTAAVWRARQHLRKKR